MGAPVRIRVAFARSVDPAEPAARLAAAGFEAAVDPGGAAIAVDVHEGTDQETLAAVAHALDAWLEDAHLPFAAQRTGPTTLVVRPPAG